MSPSQASSSSKHPADQMREPSQRAVVLSGPLGSGKTTLLNHLLETTTQSAAPGTFVVIENDIGSMNTDKARVKTSPESLLAITAGCICCNDLHSLRAALHQLKRQSQIHTMFIETTGIANPAAVKDLLHQLSIPTVVITTVDIAHFEENERLGRGTETIPFADILALTWIHDSTGARNEEALAKALSVINRLNPVAPKVEISPSGKPLDNEPAPWSTHAPTLPPRPSFSPRHPLLNLIPDTEPGHKHSVKTYSITLQIPESLEAADVIIAVREGAPKGLQRAKGHINGMDIDCTFEDWQVKKSARPHRSNHITLIGTEPLTSTAFPKLGVASLSEELSINLDDHRVRESAIHLVERLLKDIPSKVVNSGRLITETDSGEAWRYISLPGFPLELKERFLHTLCRFYLKQHDALRSGEFANHPALPFYQREVGANLSWFLIDCEEQLTAWDLLTEVSSRQPASLYFLGLNSAQDAIHVSTLKESELPALRKRISLLKSEIGAAAAEKLISAGVANCISLSIDGSWKKARSCLLELLSGE